MKRRISLRRPSSGTRGVALVTVLVIIVLVTAIVVAFTSRSRTSAMASSSSSNGVAANLLADDAVNTVIAGLKREMEASSQSVPDAPGILLPKTATDYLPKIDSDSPFSILLKTGSTMPGGLGPDWLSAVDTSKKSLNGRYYSRSRWNAPRLLTTAQAADTSLPLPKWFYLDENRNAGSLAASWRRSDFDPTGRYAFRVYDLSGLVDINVAGLPGNVATDPTLQKNISRRGSLAWTDISVAGLTGLTADRSLFNWRGPTLNFGTYVAQFGQPHGFLVSPPTTLNAQAGSQTYDMGTVNRFLSRNDLIQAVKAKLFKNQFTDDGSDFLTRVTVFSRELNAPSTSVINQAGGTALSSDLQNVATDLQYASAPGTGLNPFVPAVTILAGHAFTRRDGSLGRVGDALVKNRFPLSKIGLFAIHQSASSTAAQKAAALTGIEKYFGLKPNSDGTWRYVHGRLEDSSLDPTSGNPKRERLKTFAEVAAGASGSFAYDPQDATDNTTREPNFFEYLQAAILGDSLGQGAAANIFQNEWSDTSIARHILRIGVNLIDQYDEDSDPTVIARTPLTAMGSTSQPDPDISGVENLPYVQVIGESSFRRFDSSPYTYQRRAAPVGTFKVYPKIATYYQFQLWNPHRNAESASGQFRIVANGTLNVHLAPPTSGLTASSLASDISAPLSDSQLTPSTHWIAFGVPSTGSFVTPHLLAASDPGTTVSKGSFRYTVSGTNADILGFWCGDVDAPYNGFIAPTGPTDTSSDLQTTSTPGTYFHQDRYSTGANGAYMQVDKSQGLYFQLQKQNAGGQWLPVQTIPLTRSVNMPLSSIWTDRTGGVNYQYSARFHQSPFLYTHYAWSDPRTLHLGGGFSQHYANDQSDNVANSMLPQNNYFAMTAPGWLTTNYGNAPETAGALARYYRLARLSSNAPGSTWYKDRGNTGPRLGDTAIVGSGTEIYSAAGDSNFSHRPIVLNRPFQNLAEMSYAFRDLPWKSLNFSQDTASTGKSPADAALLDFFSLAETPVRAGVLNLNSASDEVMAALLTGTALHPGGLSPDLTALSGVSTLVSEIRAYLGPRSAPLHVIRTAADLPAMVQALPSAQTWSKSKREAVIAALADVHNGRTWNLLIDLVAQTGRFPQDDGKRENFQVTGEQHLLVHVAIDRITGKVIDQQTERAE